MKSETTSQKLRSIINNSNNNDHTPAEANDYYTKHQWWPDNEQAVLIGVPCPTPKNNSYFYNLTEILTPQVPKEGDRIVLNDLINVVAEENEEEDKVGEEKQNYRQAVSSEIEEIFEDDRDTKNENI